MQMDLNDQMIAQRAETFRLSKAYEQAIELFEQLLEKYPDNAWVNAHLGAIYCQWMDYGKAEDYLKKATSKEKDLYFWAHAQLGEIYRLRAIAENRKPEYLECAKKHFTKALNAKKPEESNYAWALAHLGATYRLEMTRELQLLSTNEIDIPSKEEALKCFNRAIELIPTYAWAWGMRATVYRLAQEYEDSYWDLEVETVISPEMGVLQNSPSPVPFLATRRVNLHEHALLSFYLTKKEEDQKRKDKHYGRAIAFAQQALILQPGDLIAQLILTVIEANQKKEQHRGEPLPDQEIQKFKSKLQRFFQDGESEFSEICKNVLREQIRAQQTKFEILNNIKEEAGNDHKLTQLILKYVEDDPSSKVDEKALLWLWKNFALTETCSIVLFLLSDFSEILDQDSIIGTAQPYRELAAAINRYYTGERLYQTPVLSEEQRRTIFGKFLVGLQ
ncbi:tetratricopeptide repeat protein [Microcoleus sp. w1-18aA5]|uniref:tetratricopeptide repeat protein n=1 Tax=unclassified Microcoleus TaxID=2642155 RepID=UPI002FD09C9B